VLLLGIAPADNAYRGVKYRGIAGGPQIGYNFQDREFVFGGVADFQGTSIRGSSSGSTPAATFTDTYYYSYGTQSTSVNPGINVQQGLTAEVVGLGTIRARGGVAVQDWVFFGTGGLAVGTIKSTISFARPALAFLGPLSVSGSHDTVRLGWTAGGGVEYALSREWSIGVEYLHFDLGKQTVKALDHTFQGIPIEVASVAQSFSANIIRASVNYHF
jgi:outer membrane immunogenic protein